MAKRPVFDHGPFGKKHNNLFRPGPNMRLNACVGKNGGPAGFDRYANGFFAAGARLVASLKEDPWEVDLIVYPLVVTYRHGVEVALKHLCHVLPGLCDEKADVKLTHRLLDNWKTVRRLLEHLGEGCDDITRVDAALKDIVEIDPRGENFRYPLAKDGTRVLQDTSLINVEVFGAEMDFVARFFEGCCCWADHLWECKCDQMAWEREIQQECEQDMAYYGQE
jgi:hypothetical protein